mgnify:FL=1
MIKRYWPLYRYGIDDEKKMVTVVEEFPLYTEKSIEESLAFIVKDIEGKEKRILDGYSIEWREGDGRCFKSTIEEGDVDRD